ncbi:MAG: hypothetical protein PHN82_06355 [bacterium]|nr:hypothetical protein [bacterium]
MSGFLKRAAVFLLGSFTVVAQVTFLREFLVVFLGNELCLGVVFSSWFLGFALGAAAAARPARRARAGEPLFPLVVSALLFLAPAVVLLIRASRLLLAVPPGEYIPFARLLLAALCLIVPFSFLVGFAFPFACLLALAGERRGVRNVGLAYVLDAVGCLAGGSIFSFALVGRVPPLPILIGWAAALFAVLALGAGPAGRRRAAALAVAVAACAAALASGAARRLDEWSVRVRWRSLNPDMPLLLSTDTRYENIAVARRNGQFDLFGNGQYYFSFPDPYGAAAAAHMIMTQHPSPGRVLLIGGGAGGMARVFLEHGLDLLRYIELDPALIRITEECLGEEEARVFRLPQVRLSHGDGRRFIKETGERFDMVVVNVPDPSTAMLNRFYTREFYREARAVLAPGGVLAARLSAPADYYGGEVASYVGSVYRTLRSVFPHVLVAPGEEHHFFASDSPAGATADLGALARRWAERGIATDAFTPHHYLIWWLPERVAFTRESLEAAARVPLNTDLRPVTYYFNLIIWARHSGSAVAGALRVLERAGAGWFLAPLAALLLARLGWLLASGRRGARQTAFHALLAVGAMGFSAIALEIILIFAFQSIYGYAYQMMGLIVALFMAGLASGGYCSTRVVAHPRRRTRPLLALAALALGLYAGIVPSILRLVGASGARSEYVFAALILVTGFVAGLEFPLAGALYERHAASIGRTAARAGAADYLGACAGALLTGVVFVPLLGIAAACRILLALNAGVAFLLLAARDD